MDIIKKLNQPKRFKHKEIRKVDLYPKKTVSVLLNTDVQRDLRVFIISQNNYNAIKYIDIIIRKPQQPSQLLKSAKSILQDREE